MRKSDANVLDGWIGEAPDIAAIGERQLGERRAMRRPAR
ncbi:hypothetical protein SAMCCGM7_pC0677 (plasmid) [Sinorhizobium americanum CCGM7]|nr:hypothetical protein SAMCCGM7_pC0677 [Sinorhizobium americanum CCGM7]